MSDTLRFTNQRLTYFDRTASICGLNMRHSVLDHSLNSSYPNEEREEISSVNADSEEPDVEEVERIRSILEETNKCYFCEYEAPVPWIHPSKGDNLSGMDIWDHLWSEHSQESEWFA